MLSFSYLVAIFHLIRDIYRTLTNRRPYKVTTPGGNLLIERREARRRIGKQHGVCTQNVK